jgi:hypothetical protein
MTAKAKPFNLYKILTSIAAIALIVPIAYNKSNGSWSERLSYSWKSLLYGRIGKVFFVLIKKEGING